MTSTYTREDVETHYGVDRPAVNVKVYDSLEDGYGRFVANEGEIDEDFTIEWIREHVSEKALGYLFWDVCRDEFEHLEGWATGKDEDPLFPGDDVRLESDGRSGGWVVVTGLPPVDEWDAVRLARWRRFARIARDVADGVMTTVVSSIYYNEWEQAKQAATVADGQREFVAAAWSRWAVVS